MRLSPQIKSLEYSRICELINLIISTHPEGFSILTGNSPPPTSQEIHDMLDSTRSPMPRDFKPTQKSSATTSEQKVIDVEYFNKSVEIAGGWSHINFCAQEFQKIDSRMWNVAADHVKYVANPSSRFYSRLSYIANKYKISRNTAIKYRRLFPKVLAMMILVPDSQRELFAPKNL